MSKHDHEAALLFAIRALGLPEPEAQYRYAPPRKLRADFAWPEARLLVECQGGLYTGQAHGSISGILADIDRGNAATLAGWKLLRVTGDMIEDGTAVSMIEQALGVRA